VSGHSATRIAPSWAGRPPADDAEASRRIRDAARRCIDRNGVNVRIAEVARELGVSRPTVYRHYPSGQAVLMAVALESIEPLLSRVGALEVDLGAAPAEVVAEVGCLLFEWLGRDPQLRQLTRFGPGGAADDVTSSAALLLTRGLIERARAPFDEPADVDHTDELAELVTRLVHSMIERPPAPATRMSEQSATLRRWITGAVDGVLAPTAESARR
jgi:AcrR family transcriptional regulator